MIPAGRRGGRCATALGSVADAQVACHTRVAAARPVPSPAGRALPSTSSSSSSASSRSSRTARLPLTTNVVVDQNAALGLIDELRVAVPEEVRAAKRINSEGERIIEKAQDEAERIVARPRSRPRS